uniref:Nucleolar protein 16 n=1 Tax=Ascaris lumbricoides TaxID=6252 RepID=A0A0M3HP82_ASCLU
MAQQHPVIEEVQLKKAEDAAPFSSAPSEHQHVDEHMMKGVHDDEKGIEAPTALESTEVAEHPKENVVDEKKGDEVADGSVVVDAAEMPSFIHDSSKHGQIVSEEMPAVEEPTLEEQHQTLAAEINRASLDEKREDEQHNEPLEYDEHIGDSKSKKQRKHKGHHPESERHDEFQQRDEVKHLIVFSTQHAQAVDEATKEVAGDTSKKHKKKRNRKSETEHHMPSPDEVQFVEGESIENDADQVEGGEFTAVISRRHKKKGRSPELENAYEETHTTEPLRELYENVEEMRGENGKSVDAIEQLSVIVAEGEHIHENEEPSGENFQRNSDSDDKQDHQRVGVESAYDSQQKTGELTSQERDDTYEQECVVEQKQPLEEFLTQQPVQIVSQERGKETKETSLKEQAIQQQLPEGPDVEAVEHVGQQKVEQTEQHFEIVKTQAEKGEEQQQHELNEPSEDRPEGHELLKHEEDHGELCNENAEQFSEKVPEIEPNERLQELKEQLTGQSVFEKSQEPALSAEHMQREPPQQPLTPQSYDLFPYEDAAGKKHAVKELTQHEQGSEYAHADMEQEFLEQLSTKQSDESRPEEGAEDQQYESEQSKAEEHAVQQPGEELHLGTELLGQVSREESSKLMAQKEVEHARHMLQEHTAREHATQKIHEGQPYAEQLFNFGPKEGKGAQQHEQENLTADKHTAQQPYEERSISMEHVEHEPPVDFESNPQQEKHEEQQKRENLAAEQNITETSCGEPELVLREHVEHELLEQPSAEHPSESISREGKEEEQHKLDDLTNYQHVTEIQNERPDPIIKEHVEHELREQPSAEQSSGPMSQEKVQDKKRVPEKLTADQHYTEKPFEGPEYVPTEHVKYELLEQPSAKEPSESKPEKREQRERQGDEGLTTDQHTTEKPYEKPESVAIERKFFEQPSSESFSESKPKERKYREQHESEKLMADEEIAEIQYRKSELIPTERMEHEMFQQPSSEGFLQFREEERIQEEQQLPEKSIADQYIAGEAYRDHEYVAAGHVERGMFEQPSTEQPTEPIIQGEQKKEQYGADELTADQHVGERAYAEPEYLPTEDVRHEMLEKCSVWKSEGGQQEKQHEPAKSVSDQHIGEKPYGEPEHVPTKYVENELIERPHAEQHSESIPQEEKQEQQHRPEELAADQDITEKPRGELELESVPTESIERSPLEQSSAEVAEDVMQEEPKELQRAPEEIIAHQRVAERPYGELESVPAEQVEHEELEPSSERSLESKLQKGEQTEQLGPNELAPEEIMAERPHGEPAVVPSDNGEHELLEPPPDSKPKEEIQEEQHSPVELTADQHVVKEAYPEPESIPTEYVEHELLGQSSAEQPSEPSIKNEPKGEQQRPVELSADQQSVEEPCEKPEYFPTENLEHEVVEQPSAEQPSESIPQGKEQEEQYRPEKLEADQNIPQKSYGELFAPAEDAKHELPEQMIPEQPCEALVQKKLEEEQYRLEKSTTDLGQTFAEQPSEPIIQDEPKEEEQVPMELTADQQFAERPHGKPEYVPTESLEQPSAEQLSDSKSQMEEQEEQYQPEDVTGYERISEKPHEVSHSFPAESTEEELREQHSQEKNSWPTPEGGVEERVSDNARVQSDSVPMEHMEQNPLEQLSSDQSAEIKPQEEEQRKEQGPEELAVDEHIAAKPYQEQELSPAKQIEEGRLERSVAIGESGFAPGSHLEGVHAQQLSDEQFSEPVSQERIEERGEKTEEVVEPSGGIMDAKETISDGVAGVVLDGKLDDTAAIEARGGVHAVEELKKTIPPAATIEASKEIVEEVIPPPTVLQRCPCEGPNKEQHTHKTTEVITIGDVPSDDQVVVDKTVTTLDAAGSPNQFAQNVGKLAEEHPELMKNANIELGEHVTGNVTITTFTTKTAVTQEPVKVAKRDPIVLALERDKRADLRQRRERVYKLLPRDVEFCTRMIEAHGNDYEAMAKDPTNVHQETAKSIQRKIRIFRESPQYETYVRSKNSSPVPPPVKG